MTSSMSGFSGVSGAGLRGNRIPSGYRHAQIQKFDPQQQKLYSELFGHAGPESYLNRLAGGDEELFNEMEAPALKQFAGLQGNLASRFSYGGGQGSLSGRNSSGFQNAAGQQASDFAQQLQSQRQSLQMQALSGLKDFSGFLLGQEPIEQMLAQKRQKQPGFLHEAGIGLAGGIGKGIGNAFGSIF